MKTPELQNVSRSAKWIYRHLTGSQKDSSKQVNVVGDESCTNHYHKVEVCEAILLILFIYIAALFKLCILPC